MVGVAALQDLGQLERHGRRDDHFATRDAPNRIDDVVRIHVLQQVTASARPKSARHVVLGGAHREHGHGNVATFLSQALQQADAVHRRHLQVHDHEVGNLLLDDRDRLVGVARGTEYGDAGAQFEEFLEAATAQAMIVDEDYADPFIHGGTFLRARSRGS